MNVFYSLKLYHNYLHSQECACLVVTNKIPRDKLIISDNLVAFSGNLKAEGSALVLLNFISKLEDINKGHRIKAVTFLRKPNSRNSLFIVDVEFIKVFSRA